MAIALRQGQSVYRNQEMVQVSNTQEGRTYVKYYWNIRKAYGCHGVLECPLRMPAVRERGCRGGSDTARLSERQGGHGAAIRLGLAHRRRIRRAENICVSVSSFPVTAVPQAHNLLCSDRYKISRASKAQ